jgi:hypothetical protein
MNYFNKKHIIFSLFTLSLVVLELPLLSQFIDDRSSKSNLQFDNLRWPAHIAYDIKIDKENEFSKWISLSWRADPGYTGKFAVFKSTSIINNASRLYDPSTKRLRLVEGRNIAVDDALERINYYAVIAEERLNSVNIEFISNVNFTSMPLIIDGNLGTLRGIQATLVQDGNVLLKWDLMPESGYIYTVYRSRALIDSPVRVANAEKVAIVQDSAMYLDRSIISQGTYFYAITVRPINGEERISLIPKSTYTTEGIFIDGKFTNRVADRIIVSSFRALSREDQIILLWTYSGSAGNKYYRIFKTKTRPESISDPKDYLRNAYMIDDVDITLERFVYKNPSHEEWYYGIVPYPQNINSDFRFIPGVNVTSEIFKIPLEKRVELKDENKEKNIEKNIIDKNIESKQIEPRKSKEIEPKYLEETKTKKIEQKEIMPDEAEAPYVINAIEKKPKKKIEKKTENKVERVEKVEKVENEIKPLKIVIDIDIVLRRTFFAGNYNRAIKELDLIAKVSSDEKEVAKAKLFIGRSYVELDDYEKALEYFMANDVIKFFYEEASFWRDYSLLRIN